MKPEKSNKITATPLKSSGYTLIEVMLALVILTIGILALNAMQLTATSGNATALHISLATTWNSDKLEQILALPYDDDQLEDTDGDGTDQDTTNKIDGTATGYPEGADGLDDDGDDFGLNDIGAAADHWEDSPDGLYTIYWNVATNHPAPRVKTIRVIVMRQKDNAQLAIFDTHKADT